MLGNTYLRKVATGMATCYSNCQLTVSLHGALTLGMLATV